MNRARGSIVFFGTFACVGHLACSLAFPVHEAEPPGPSGDGGTTDSATLDGAKEESGSAARHGYREEVVADGPLLYLRFGENAGPTAKDEQHVLDGVYQSSGVVYGAKGAIAGDSDTAITLDGTAGISMPQGFGFEGQAPFSVEVWAMQTAYVSYGQIADHSEYAGVRNGWTLRSGYDKFGIERWKNNETSGSVVFGATPLPLGQYHHLVSTYDGTKLALYLDGIIVGAPVVTAALSGPADGPWTIGKQNCVCTGQAFQGTLDELAVYSIALPSERVLAHYQAGIGGSLP